MDLDACVGDRNVATLVALLPPGRALESLRISDGGIARAGASQLAPGIQSVGRRLRVLDLAGNFLDGPAAQILCQALANSPLQILDLASNRLCGVRRNGRASTRKLFIPEARRFRPVEALPRLHARGLGPRLVGVEACVQLARSTTTLRALDLRSNGLTEQAGNLFARCLTTRDTCEKSAASMSSACGLVGVYC